MYPFTSSAAPWVSHGYAHPYQSNNKEIPMNLYETLLLVAEMDGDAHRNKDPKAAVDRAFVQHLEIVTEDLMDEWRRIRWCLMREVKEGWSKT